MRAVLRVVARQVAAVLADIGEPHPGSLERGGARKPASADPGRGCKFLECQDTAMVSSLTASVGSMRVV